MSHTFLSQREDETPSANINTLKTTTRIAENNLISVPSSGIGPKGSAPGPAALVADGPSSMPWRERDVARAEPSRVQGAVSPLGHGNHLPPEPTTRTITVPEEESSVAWRRSTHRAVGSACRAEDARHRAEGPVRKRASACAEALSAAGAP